MQLNIIGYKLIDCCTLIHIRPQCVIHAQTIDDRPLIARLRRLRLDLN